MFVDLSVPIREAIVGDSAITALLPAYLNSRPVFTRTPVPENAPSPRVVISQDISTAEEDGISDFRPVVTKQVVVSGESKADWKAVDDLARLIVALFHRQPHALTVTGWTVVDIRATTAGGVPIEQDQAVSVVVTLTVRLAKAS